MEHALDKEQEIPRLIDILFSKLLGTEPHMPAPQSKKKRMRSAEEILTEYGLSSEVQDMAIEKIKQSPLGGEDL